MNMVNHAVARAFFKGRLRCRQNRRAFFSAASTWGCAALAWLSLTTTAPALTRAWKDAVDGQWSDANRWSPAGAPVAGDDIVITNSGAFTVTIAAAVSCRSLLLGGESGTQSIDWVTGQLPAAVLVSDNGVLNVTSNTGGWTLSGAVTNFGRIAWRNSSQTAWNWTPGGRLENAPGGVLDVQLDGTITMSGGAGSFNNRGTWRKSAGSGTLTLGNSITFTNAAAVEVQQGAIAFGAGFTSSGTFSVASNAAVRLTGGTFRLLPGHAFSGGGFYGVPGGGSAIVDGPITEPNFQMNGSSLTLNSPLSGTLQWTAGTLAGAWSVASNGVVNVTSNAGGWFLSGAVTNYGQVVWRSGSPTLWYWLPGARLENAPGGLLDVQLDGSIMMSGGAGSFNNRGIWRKSAGSGTLTLGNAIAFTNAAAVEVQQGALVFGAGFTSGGTFSVSNGAAVRLTGGTFRLQPGHAFSGDGYYGVPGGGSATVDGPITEPNFQMNGSSLTLNSPLSGTLQWTAGTLAGAWSIASNGVVNVTSNTGGWFLSGVVTNFGQVVWRSASQTLWYWLPGARLENAPGGVLDVQQDGTITMSGGAGSFNNRGTWRKSAGSGTLTLGNAIAFTNAAAVEVQQGALVFGAGFTSGGTFSVSNGAAVRLTGGTFRLLPGHAFSGGGYYGVPGGGSAIVDGPITEPNFQMGGASLTLNSPMSGTLQWTAGTLAGAWSVASNGVLNVTSNTGGWTLSGAVTNYGQVVWRSGSQTTWIWASGTRFENAPEGLLDVQLDGTMTVSGGAGSFNNLGTWRKSAGSGTLTLGTAIAFTNAGLVEVQQGALVFGAGFTSSGAFSVASGAAVRLTGGTFRLLPGHAFSGGGYYGVPGGGSATIDGPITEPNFRFDGATLTLNSPLSGTLQWAGGTLAGAWSIASNGVLNVTSNTGGWVLSGVVTNHGQMVWRSGSQTTWYWASGARFENAPEGLLDVQLDGTILMSGGAGSFNNRGTWRKSAGSGTLTLGNTLAFTNAGLVEVQQGALVFGAGFTSGGAFSVASGAAVRLTGGTFRLLPGHAFSGGGYYGVPSGTVTIEGPITEPDFRFDSGNLNLNSPLSGTLQWTSGTLSGSWSIATNGTLNLATNGVSWMLSGTLANYGSIIWRPGSGGTWYWLSAYLENQPSGLVDIQKDGAISKLSGTVALHNRGLWRKSGGTGSATFGTGIGVTNSGAISAQKGTLALPATYAQSDGLLSVAIRATNDYGRIMFTGTAPLTGRLETALAGGFRPPPGATFQALTFSGYTGMVSGFNGIDLDNGLRLDPRVSPSSLSLVATAYDTNEVKRVGCSLLGNQHIFLWWPVAFTNSQLQAATDLLAPSWNTVPATDHNAVLTTDLPARFFSIGAQP